MRLCFRVPARCVRFLQTPSHFFQVSSFLISRAERRVALAALYVGSGPRERFLVDLLRQRMQDVACKRECDRPGGVFRDFLWREEQTGAGSGETLAAKAAQRRGGQGREENNGGSERNAASARTERESEADFESRRRRLQVDILVDHLRGTRKDKTGCSSASVLASLLKREERVSEVDVLSTGADLSPQFCRPGHENSSNASALKASSPSSSSTVSPSSSSSPSRSSECSSSLSSARSSPSSSPSLASFSGEEDLTRISFFHNPLASSSLLGRLLPPRVNEVLGVQHMKALVVDDAVLLTGANFSEEYMVNRADRYVVVNDAAVAHAVCRLIQTVQRGSFCLRLREQRRGEEAPGEADATRGRLSEAPENRPTNARTAAGGEETGARGFDCVTATSTETRSAHRGAEGGEERFAGLDSEAKNGGKAAKSRSRGEDEGGAEAQRGERGKNGGRVETEDAKERGEDDFDVVWDPQFTLTSNPTQDPAAFSCDFYRLLKEACEGVSSTAFLASEVKPYNAKTETVSCTPSTQSKEASCDAGHPATRGQVLVETAGDSGVCTLELALQAGFTNPPVDDLARVLDEIFVEAGSEGSPSAVSGSECMKNSPNAEESTHAAPPFRPASRSEEDAGRASTAASSGSSSVVSEDEKDAATPPYSSTNVSKAVVLASPYLNLPTRLLRRLVALCVEHSDALESRPEAPRAERELPATSGICDEVLRSRKMAVVTASPQANSFHKSKGVSRYIPEAYAYIAYRVSRLLEHAAHKTPSAGRGFLGHRHPREARDSDAEAAVHAQRELCSARLSEKSIGSSRPGSEAVALQTTGGNLVVC
ncbi:phospholipase D active site domain-containing protein [Toxoplasma gondii GT1]|uniref:CDP-diacylglycerol--glycerol-3-phosphate 3-phosphatidyltransferase n=3 Tax=Toxoplasma gondii TaxID=5811 RepID=A0A1L2DW24_TOXGO|nr:phosphatidylglycerol phosphate synthase [Toxoplasma gondii]EPR63592.1 phospholipase D active site domain-containing protein [Toxoplasma gondii GT1]KAF4638470.1 phospholipase D active site domain-containing protein [Toxoplasma gondii]KFG53934.1 phospholipase D active site domain-containing protein [Toxoplasma gondii FOU]